MTIETTKLHMCVYIIKENKIDYNPFFRKRISNPTFAKHSISISEQD